jgi:hypothetical protein
VRCVFARVPLARQSVLTPPEEPEGAAPVDQGPLPLHKAEVALGDLPPFPSLTNLDWVYAKPIRFPTRANKPIRYIGNVYYNRLIGKPLAKRYFYSL